MAAVPPWRVKYFSGGDFNPRRRMMKWKQERLTDSEAEWPLRGYRMRKIVLFVLIALVLSFSVPASSPAEPLDDVVKAFESNDYKTAYRLTRPLAEKGLPKAQNILGYMYQSGQGVGKDYAEALKWYRKAADQGDGEGQNNVGVMYENGQGVWEDPSEAVKWYARAAEQGIPRAQNNLGIMYAVGKGVPQDYVTAYVWFHLAASGFPASNKESRQQALENKDNVAYNLTLDQVAKAQKLAREWKPMKGP